MSGPRACRNLPLNRQSVTTKEAYSLLGVSRARFHEWKTAGLISPAWFNGNRPMYLRVEVLALPDRLGAFEAGCSAFAAGGSGACQGTRR